MRRSEGVFIVWEEEWRPLNVPCQWSMCFFTMTLGSNHHKINGGDGVELCFFVCLHALRRWSKRSVWCLRLLLYVAYLWCWLWTAWEQPGPSCILPICVDVVPAAPTSVDYIELHSLWNWYLFKYSKWYVHFDPLNELFATKRSKYFFRLFCYERKFKLLLFLIFAKLYMYYLISFDAHFGISCKTSL